MFWMVSSLAGLLMFAVTLGQYSVWLAVLKLALIVALAVIVLMGVALTFKRSNQN